MIRLLILENENIFLGIFTSSTKYLTSAFQSTREMIQTIATGSDTSILLPCDLNSTEILPLVSSGYSLIRHPVK